MKDRTYFFGWENIKWFLRNMLYMYSSENGKKSEFSKQRFESGFGFIVLIWGVIHWMNLNVSKIMVESLGIWCGILIPFIVYTAWSINKYKVKQTNTEPTKEEVSQV